MPTVTVYELKDLTKFAPLFLKIKNKSGILQPLKFNRAQMYVHAKLEKQLAETGKVRALVLKGRQQGLSTYISSRNFHNVITRYGKKAFILCHEFEATKNLFDMTKRYYDNLPKGLCPKADTSSAKELYFKAFDSGYAVGTTGNRNTGRSQTIQLFHGSEVAYWQFAEEHAEGVMQAVADEAGTEIILESTANGIGNYFHQRWMDAVKGLSQYQAIFVPWYWEDGYVTSDTDMQLHEDEEELLKYYQADGLTTKHLAWRRVKLKDLSNDHEQSLERFKQVYPFSANEAFINPIANVFIPPKLVMRARKSEVMSDLGLIIGVDVAISDNDRTAIVRRRGRLVYDIERITNYNTMEICGKVKRIIEREHPVKVFIDCIGVGAGVVDRLQEMGYDCVEGVNVARSANEKVKFRNLRAELWSEMRDWFCGELPVQIPDDDDLHGELCSLGFKENSQGQIQIESKDELRARGMPSPDMADALALTFYDGQFTHKSMYPADKLKPHERGMFM